MFCLKLFLFLYLVHISYCDWAEDWMLPVQEQINENPSRRMNPVELKMHDSDNEKDLRMVQVIKESSEDSAPVVFRNNDLSTSSLKTKLENTLESAENLVETLKAQIVLLTERENLIKEAIANGRSGTTTVTVSTMAQAPKTYLINDGVWTLCNGMIQFPSGNVPTSLYKELFTAPRCIGQEVNSYQDPCVFNSVIKYETIPVRRRLDYTEDDFLCLKPSFNHTLEQYLSVPKHVVNETCRNGVVRSLSENNELCGLRILAEYTYYPHRSSDAATLPLEYCVEKDRSCKMIVAWHVSNVTIENFEFLKNEYNFKKYFIRTL